MAMKKFSLIASFTVLSGCVAQIDNRGYELEGVDFTKVQPGVHTSEQVQQLLGTPSSTSAFRPETWYYISKVTSTKAFFTPQVLDEKIVAIKFNDAGIVETVTESKGEDRQEIKPVKRETKTAGHETGVLREIFSNFGKISAKKPKQPGQ
jgi:outer membrane protein assembly factor BamE (lipoprotein component of BamABCDE complex)